MEKENPQVDEIVAMIDQFMGRGGGHMNLWTGRDDAERRCPACGTPTLFQGLDETDSKRNAKD